VMSSAALVLVTPLMFPEKSKEVSEVSTAPRSTALGEAAPHLRMEAASEPLPADSRRVMSLVFLALIQVAGSRVEDLVFLEEGPVLPLQEAAAEVPKEVVAAAL
jgi:hypothetical protein